MKIFRYIAPILLLLLPSCRQQEVPSAPVLVEHILYASAAPGEDGPDSRTVLDVIDDKKILWSPRESISILSNGGNYPFRGNNENVSASASFSGMGPAELGNYIALYPYDASASYSGGYVSTILPVNQTGRAGSFADGCLITADDATGSNISFNHICSGLRFMVNSDKIKTVSIRGNNGERIAGDFRFRFTAEDTPVSEAGTDECVTLRAPGGSFENWTYYYIVILPTVFSKGFTLIVDDGTQIGELRFDSEVTFSTGSFKNITGRLDERVSNWTASMAYYGPENTFCLRPGGTVTIDVSPRLIYGTWQRSGIPATGADVPASAAVLWGDATVSLSGSTLTMGSSTAGTSLVAIKSASGTILWSYLLWVTADAPAETTLPGDAVILPELGDNLYFQWGRKDPLRPGFQVVAHPGGDTALSLSIQNPETFINHGTNGCDWYSGKYDKMDGTLWGGVDGKKTVWDPCPAGWRVPSNSDFNSLTEDTSEDLWHFQKLGTLIPDTSITVQNEYDYGWESYCWTREPISSDTSSSLLMETDSENFYGFSLPGNARYIGMSIRCVKE